jgi:hypothetical protein
MEQMVIQHRLILSFLNKKILMEKRKKNLTLNDIVIIKAVK